MRTNQESASSSAIADLAQQVGELSHGLGFGAGHYQLIRIGSNIVFSNEDDQLVARVAPQRVQPQDLETKLTFCQHLVDSGLLILPPHRASPAPLVDGRSVTFWPLAQDNVKLEGGDFASLAAACHRLRPLPSLDSWTPVQWIAYRHVLLNAGIAAGLPRDIAERLHGLLEEKFQSLTASYEQSKTPLTFIHGDLCCDNIVRFKNKLLLCDFDSIALGPPEKDLANILVDCRRFLGMRCWQQLLAAYSLAYDKQLLYSIAATKELGDCIWLASLWGLRPDSHEELVWRLDGLDNLKRRWHYI